MQKQTGKTIFYETLPIIISAFTALLLIFYPAGSSIPTVKAANYNQQKQEVAIQKAKINDNLSQITSSLTQTQQLGATLKDEIASKDDEVDKTEVAIGDVNTLMATLDTQIAENQKMYDETIISIKSLFIELQKQQSPFQILLSSENIADALTKFYSTSVLQSKADEYRIRLEESTAMLQDAKTEQVQAKTKLEQTKSLLASQQSYLVDLKAKTQNDESKYQQLKSALVEENKQLEAKMAQIDAERKKEEDEARKQAEEEARRQAQSGGSPSTGQSSGSSSGVATGTTGCWFEDKRPLNVPSGYLSAPAQGFLVRGLEGCVHDAVDIANGTNTPLVAVAPGTVVRKGSFDVTGYGNYVVVRIVLPSGQEIYTLYAHMNSSSPRQVGDSVKRGDLVGYMGCTGECFGTHVHFMIYSDTYETNGPGCRLGSSKCYNPIKYIDF